jgi:hypothetical protein
MLRTGGLAVLALVQTEKKVALVVAHEFGR